MYFCSYFLYFALQFYVYLWFKILKESMETKESDSINRLLLKIEKGEVLLTRFEISKVDDFFDAIGTPGQLNVGGIFICLNGVAEFFLDLKGYKIRAGNMCVVFPLSTLSLICKSDDFKGICFIGNIELFKNIQLPSSTDYYLYIKYNPCISLSKDEQEMLIGIVDAIKQKYDRIDHPFRIEITDSIFRMLYYEIAAIYKKGKPIAQKSLPRKDMLVRKFMFMLTKNYRKNRSVNYYARKLCLTPRYLSSVIKEKTGSGASFWINNMVIRQAKSLLKNSQLSVSQISEELNFPNSSFFGQYFKKYTGMTPKKYRDLEV
jgi:AraC-like DNA-binding protein